MGDDLAKACGTYKIFVLFDENTDLVLNRYLCLCSTLQILCMFIDFNDI